MRYTIAAALGLALAALLALAPVDTCPREVTEIGAVVISVNGNVTTFRDRNGGTWVHDNFTPTRDYYMLVVDNMGTSYPYDDIILSLSED